VAAAHDRKVAYVGRSMVRNMGVAAELDLLHVPPGLLVSIDEAAAMPPNMVVLISTGSQGEPLSALARMASRDHRQIRIAEDDTVILASSLVPGNETAVYRVINGLARWGARVIHKEVAKVHVSGHAPAGELLYLLNVTKPSNVMPIHGEWRHLRAHARLAQLTGVPAERVVLAEDGVVVDLIDGRAKISGRVEVGRVYVDGLAVGDIGESTLGDRLVLGEGGFISITLAVESATGRAVAPPTVSGRGFSDDPKALAGVIPLIEAELAHIEAEGITDTHRIAQSVRRVVGRWVADNYRRRPMIVPTVIPV
jgi:ribonuclease J